MGAVSVVDSTRRQHVRTSVYMHTAREYLA